VIPGNIRDITARTQADAALYARNADLEHRVRHRTVQLDALNHDLEMFNAAGSHDLHAPRRQIDSVIDALRDDSAEQLEADGLQRIRHMEAATQRMHVLIDALLALSGVSRHALQWQVVDLRALAHVVAADLHHRQPPCQVDWVIADGLTAYDDPRLRHIVLDNLLSTAWKFTATTAQARLEWGRRRRRTGRRWCACARMARGVTWPWWRSGSQRSSACTATRNVPAPASASRPCNASSTGTAAGSGPRARCTKGPRGLSPFPWSRPSTTPPSRVLLIRTGRSTGGHRGKRLR
jgi:hypothetical protein